MLPRFGKVDLDELARINSSLQLLQSGLTLIDHTLHIAPQSIFLQFHGHQDEGTVLQ